MECEFVVGPQQPGPRSTKSCVAKMLDNREHVNECAQEWAQKCSQGGDCADANCPSEKCYIMDLPTSSYNHETIIFSLKESCAEGGAVWKRAPRACCRTRSMLHSQI